MPKRPTVTIKDIAKKLGMSHSTVSRGLNDHPNISDRTKNLVQRTANRLGYVPNSSARIIRGAPGSLIGLVVPDVQNDFYSTIAKLLAEKCNASGYQMVLAITEDSPIVERGQVQALVEARAAGIVITPTAAPELRTFELLRYAPAIQLVRHLPEIVCDAVTIDDAVGTAAATEHLIRLGHKSIAYIGAPRELSTGAARLTGFLDAQRDAGLEPHDEMICLGVPRQRFGRQAMVELMASKISPTAVVLGSSGLTVGVLEAMQSVEHTIAGHYSIVGYGDPPWFRLLRPSLTAIGLPVTTLVETTASLLFNKIRDQTTGEVRSTRAKPVHVAHQPHLIVRESTVVPAKR